MSVYLGFDYGRRRIGVAVANTITGSAQPLPTVQNQNTPDWGTIERLIAEWRPTACVVGLPLDLDGHEQAMTTHAREFATALQEKTGLPVHLCDERLSTRAAMEDLRAARADGTMTRRIRKGDRDGAAARLILEQWLAEQPKSR